MLTINAEGLNLMRRFHKSTYEKRMMVVLHRDRYADWPNATLQKSMDFIRPLPAPQLQVA